MSRSGAKNAEKKLISVVLAVIIAIAAVILERTGVADKIFDSENNSPQTTSAEIKDSSSVYLNAYFLDVGQGDCTIFVSDSKAMLIDCGEAEYAQTVSQTVSQLGIEQLDYVVFTHAHSDHIGAAEKILESVEVKNILLSEPSDNSASTSLYGNFSDAVQNSNANIILAQPDYTFTLGNAECTVLAPFSVNNENENNNSIVMTVTAGKTTFLMTGDAEKSVEKEIIKKYPDLKADILKTAHHGSSTSSSKDFITAVSPSYAIISCGKNNMYGHPAKKTLATFDALGVKYYRTDMLGSINISCTKNDYTVQNF